jgi:hypothetical protein
VPPAATVMMMDTTTAHKEDGNGVVAGDENEVFCRVLNVMIFLLKKFEKNLKKLFCVF